MTDFWGGFWLGVIITGMLWGLYSRVKPDTDFKWSDKSNWHPDYRDPRKPPRVLKRTEKK